MFSSQRPTARLETGPGTVGSGNWRIEFIGTNPAQWLKCEEELLSCGMPLPFASRCGAASIAEFTPRVFVAILDPRGRCIGGFAVQSRPARLLAGHHLLRVEQFGSSVPLLAAEEAIRRLVQWVRRDRRILRMNIDVFSFDEDRRQLLNAALARNGFHRAEHAGNYAETLVVDLAPSEDEIFNSLHHSARRKIRQLGKCPLAVRPVHDHVFAPRMNQLLHETFERTGGTTESREWGDRIDLSIRNPSLSRIAGLFRTDIAGPHSLLAYAWGCHGVDHAFYSEAASTRDTGELRIAVAYGVMWDLIIWAKRTGARLFDLGGVTRGTHMDDDPLGGISDFKRYFSQHVVRVRDEWILDGHSWRAALALAIHRRIRRQ